MSAADEAVKSARRVHAALVLASLTVLAVSAHNPPRLYARALEQLEVIRPMTEVAAEPTSRPSPMAVEFDKQLREAPPPRVVVIPYPDVLDRTGLLPDKRPTSDNLFVEFAMAQPQLHRLKDVEVDGIEGLKTSFMDAAFWFATTTTLATFQRFWDADHVCYRIEHDPEISLKAYLRAPREASDYVRAWLITKEDWDTIKGDHQLASIEPMELLGFDLTLRFNPLTSDSPDFIAGEGPITASVRVNAQEPLEILLGPIEHSPWQAVRYNHDVRSAMGAAFDSNSFSRNWDRPFARVFPALDQATSGFQELPIDDVAAVLRSLEQRDNPSGALWGVPLPEAATWGPAGIILLQLYLLGYIRRVRATSWQHAEVPWLVLSSSHTERVLASLTFWAVPPPIILVVVFLFDRTLLTPLELTWGVISFAGSAAIACASIVEWRRYWQAGDAKPG